MRMFSPFGWALVIGVLAAGGRHSAARPDRILVDPHADLHAKVEQAVTALSRRTPDNLEGPLPSGTVVRAVERMDGIVRIQLHRLSSRLEPRKIVLDVSEAAMTWLADRGYDPVYGARPLKRVIQKALLDPLAELILAGAVKDGETLPVDADAAGLSLGDHASTTAREQNATVH